MLGGWRIQPKDRFTVIHRRTGNSTTEPRLHKKTAMPPSASTPEGGAVRRGRSSRLLTINGAVLLAITAIGAVLLAITVIGAVLLVITVILRQRRRTEARSRLGEKFAVITDPAPGALLARTPAGQGILNLLGRLASGVTLRCRPTTAPS